MEKAHHTKRAIASAFKEILKKEDFCKMNVAQITNQAEMSRKSFYYHFQDKYDLVNWIFDMEFADVMERKDIRGWRCLEHLCHYLYSEPQYHRRLLHITGQNSLSDHIGMFVQKQVFWELSEDPLAERKSIMITDALMAMLKRWFYDMTDLSATEFISLVYEIHAHDARKAAQGSDFVRYPPKHTCFRVG